VGVRLVEAVTQAPPPPPTTTPNEELVSEGWMDRFRLRDYPRWTDRQW
jgi:hypothetical protein